MDGLMIDPAQASCLIANLFVQLEQPCPCRADAVEIRGETYDGGHAAVVLSREGVRYYGPTETARRVLRGACTKTLCPGAPCGNESGCPGQSAGIVQHQKD